MTQLNQVDETLLHTTDNNTTAKLWRPLRAIFPVDTTVDTITKLQKRVTPPTPAGQKFAGEVGAIPEQLLSLHATESPSKQQDRVFSEVAVSFTRDSGDPAYDHVNIWLRGYKGNTNRVLETQGKDSPVYFLLETTGETVTITAQPVGADGTTAPIELSRSCTVLLDGVISAPPAPTVTQSLIATPSGYQFTFAQLSAQAADVIDSYKVYRNTSNTSGSATVIRTYKHDPKNASAPIVVQDAITGGTFYYYWVSAVNTTGLESVLTAAQTGAVDALGRGQKIVNAITSGIPAIVSGTTTTASYLACNTISLPGAFEVWVYTDGVNTSIVDFLLWASNTSSKPNGYMFRFTNAGSSYAGQLTVVTAGAWGASIGTQMAAVSPAILPAGWHKLRGEWGADGILNVYVDDVWQVTANSTSYTPTGAVYAGGELTLTNVKISDTDGSTNLNNQGSLATITGINFTYTSTTTSITWSWSAGVIYNLDGSQISVAGSSYAAITGLTASTTYFFGAYYDIASGQVVVEKSDTTSGTAKCSLAQQAQDFNLDGRVPLAVNFTGSTTSSGGGGGTGGGIDHGCFSENTRVRTRRGLTPFAEIKAGDYVLTARFTWRKVLGVTRNPYVGEMLDMGGGELVTPGHLIHQSGKWAPAEAVMPDARREEWDGRYIWNLHVEAHSEDEHSYTLANGYVVHNVLTN